MHHPLHILTHPLLLLFYSSPSVFLLTCEANLSTGAVDPMPYHLCNSISCIFNLFWFPGSYSLFTHAHIIPMWKKKQTSLGMVI